MKYKRDIRLEIALSSMDSMAGWARERPKWYEWGAAILFFAFMGYEFYAVYKG